MVSGSLLDHLVTAPSPTDVWANIPPLFFQYPSILRLIFREPLPPSVFYLPLGTSLAMADVAVHLPLSVSYAKKSYQEKRNEYIPLPYLDAVCTHISFAMIQERLLHSIASENTILNDFFSKIR